MTRVYLGFKAFDVHELLCHFVAQRVGLYRQQGFDVALLDTALLPEDHLPELFFSAACGAALMTWLQGAPNRVVLCNTDKPMFWLYSRDNISDISQLNGTRIGSYPGMAPPAQFLKNLLRSNEEKSLQQVSLLACSNDTARLGLLKSGDVDAALISSAIPPAAMAKQGFRNALPLSQFIRVPTTGLAIKESLLKQEPQLVSSMVSVFQQSLEYIDGDPALVSEILEESFSFPKNIIPATIAMIQQHYGKDGRSTAAIQNQAIVLMAEQLGCGKPHTCLYDFSLLQ